MRVNFWRMVACFGILSCFLSCVPSRTVIREKQSGQVINAETQQPIKNAEIVVETFTVTSKKQNTLNLYKTLTDASGHFLIPELKKTFVLIVGVVPKFSNVDMKVCVSGNGFGTKKFQSTRLQSMGPWSAKLPEVIELETSSDPNSQNCFDQFR